MSRFRHRSTRWLRASALAGALVALAAATAAADTLVYRPRSRLAEELLPLAQAALAGEGNAVVDPGTNSLVLLAPAPALARARALLEQQDQALHNVVVHYESRRASELASAGLRVDWQVASGALRVGNVLAPGAGSFVAVRPEAGEARERGGSQGMLRVLEGQPARIAAGVEVPVTTRSVSRYGVQTSTAFVQAQSGFDVLPRVLGDGRVRLDIAPFDARVTGSAGGLPVVARSGSATSVTVAPGDRVVVASLAGDSSASGAGLASGGSTSRSHDEQFLVVWVEIE